MQCSPSIDRGGEWRQLSLTSALDELLRHAGDAQRALLQVARVLEPVAIEVRQSLE